MKSTDQSTDTCTDTSGDTCSDSYFLFWPKLISYLGLIGR